jgi:hypothetical protein
MMAMFRNTLLTALLSIMVMSSAFAQQTYAYTGLPFTTFPDISNVPGDNFTTSDKITGIINFNPRLAPNLLGVSVTPISFSFTDGVNTFNNNNSSIFTISINTDSSGNILNTSHFTFFFATTPNHADALGLNLNSPGDAGITNITDSLGTDVTTGEGTNSTLGVWNTNAPIPTLGQWAKIAFIVLLAGLGIVVLRRRVA